ncbi:MAG: DUF935 family protein [Imperialibacter sp.]|uniref:phage portal protein family protein n=1 Tax=Imperialibacter sp. TaxID=2038411 RepID=UPI0032EDD7A8
MKHKTTSSTKSPAGGLNDRDATYASAYISLKASEQKLIDKLVAGFTDRSRKDIKKWREALEKIDDPMNPSRKEYHALVKDLKIDAHYKSQVLVRKMAFMSKKFLLVDENGEENPDATKLMQKPWFNQVRKRFIETRMSGTELAEIYEILEGEIEQIKWYPKDRILPERKRVFLTEYDFEGSAYDDPKHERFMIELGEADEFGLMADLAPMIIWKRNALQAWADFAQLFGMPLRVATTDKSSDKDLDRIEAMLEKMGQAAQAVFPVGTEVKFVENVKSDAYNVYLKQAEFHNSEISKAINGVTMLSDNGSSMSQSQVHFEVHKSIVEADMTDFEEEVNFNILWKLQELGQSYSILNGLSFKFDRTESLGKVEQWKMYNEAAQHWELDPDQVEENFGIKILGPKQGTAPTTDGNFKKGSAAPAARNRIEVTSLLPALPDATAQCCGKSHTPLQGGRGVTMVADPSAYTSLLEKVARQVFDKEATGTIPSGMYQEYARQLNEAFKSGFKPRLDAMDYTSPDNYKAALYQANIYRFSAAGTWADVVNLNKLRREAKSFDQFKQMVSGYTGMKENWLLAEYNNAEATSQNAAAWLRQQEQKDDYDLQYQTVGDNNVRVSHQILNGFTAPVDDDTWDKIYPPNAWNCRCEVIQVPKGSAPYTSKDQVTPEAVQKGFSGNRGKTNFIFEAAHSYFKEFPKVGELDHSSFGLKSWSKLKRTGKALETTIATQEDFVRELQQYANQFDGRGAYYQDELGRWFRGDVEQLSGISSEQAWQAFPYLDEVFLTPDELWITKSSANSYTSKYLKNYKGTTIVVEAKAENESLTVVKWYQVTDTTALDAERIGLLTIKK